MTRGERIRVIFGSMVGLALVMPVYGLNCNVGIEFYPSGEIKQCELNGDHTFYTRGGETITCVSDNPLTQHPNGKLASCKIKKDHKLSGIECQGSGLVEFDADGKLMRCKKG